MSEWIDPRRIPIIGHDIYQAGQVYRIWSQPCGIDPWIAVQASFTYTPMLLWSLFKPDWGDLTFTRGGRPHHRKGFRRFRLDGAMLAPAPTKPGVTMALFSGYQILQRIGWYMIVVDAATDFAVNWSSMAYQWSGCRVAGLASAQGRGGPVDYGGVEGEFTATYNAPETEHVYPGEASGGIVYIPTKGPKTCAATITCEVKPWSGSDPELLGVDLVRNTTGQDPVRIPMSGSGDPKGVSTWTGADTLAGGEEEGTNWRMIMRCRDPWLTVLDGKITADGAPATGLEHDP